MSRDASSSKPDENRSFPSSQKTQTAFEAGSSTANDTHIALTRHPNLVMIKNTPKGRGVFAVAAIPARTVVEVSPVLVLDSDADGNYIQNTKLWFYTYNWRSPPTKANSHTGLLTQTQALTLGLGSLFNHASIRSHQHNIGFTRDFDNETVTYRTLKDVAAGEELCICYGEDGRLTFADVDADGEVGVHEEEADSGGPELVEVVDISIFGDNEFGS